MTLSAKIVDILLEGYQFSSTQINLPQEQRDFLLEWGKVNVPDNVLNAEDGRENDPHATLLFGLLESEPSPALRQIIEATPMFKVQFGPISLFRQPETDVVKADLLSAGLRRLNLRLRGHCPNEQTHPSFRPHATVAYVKSGSCDNLVGRQIFAGEGAPQPFFWAKEVKFSGKDGHQETISLRRDKPVEEAVDPFPGIAFCDVETLLRARGRLTFESAGPMTEDRCSVAVANNTND